MILANSTAMARSPLGNRRGGEKDAAMAHEGSFAMLFAQVLVLVTPLTRDPGPARCAPDTSSPEPAFSMSLTPEAVKILSKITTATITTVLLKKGLRNVWMRGARPLKPGLP